MLGVCRFTDRANGRQFINLSIAFGSNQAAMGARLPKYPKS
jgi:hypothetical protein